MIKKFLFILFLCLFHLQSFSQDIDPRSAPGSSLLADPSEAVYPNSLIQSNSSDFQRFWAFGGSIGLSFWDDQTSILLAPKAYYNISPKFLTGFGITYIYSDYDVGLIDYKSNSFGGSVIMAVRPTPFLQLDAEYEGLQTNRSGFIEDDFFNNALYLGASFVSGKVSFGFRYDVLYDANRSLYASAFNPVIGFYF